MNMATVRSLVPRFCQELGNNRLITDGLLKSICHSLHQRCELICGTKRTGRGRCKCIVRSIPLGRRQF
jgi:hypothetical protein